MRTTADKNIREKEIVATKVWVEGRKVFLELFDERIIAFPADRYKILSNATDQQLKEVINDNCFSLRTTIKTPDQFSRFCASSAKSAPTTES